MATMAQLNTRMSSELKAAGDQVLAQAGVSPTKLVRLVWSKVATGTSGLQQLLQVLQTVEPSTKGPTGPAVTTPHNPAAPAAADATPVALGPTIFSDGLARLGISSKTADAVAQAATSSTWKDLREDAVFGRLQQRGIV